MSIPRQRRFPRRPIRRTEVTPARTVRRTTAVYGGTTGSTSAGPGSHLQVLLYTTYYRPLIEATS